MCVLVLYPRMYMLQSVRAEVHCQCQEDILTYRADFIYHSGPDIPPCLDPTP
jgi:hypothetical protein